MEPDALPSDVPATTSSTRHQGRRRRLPRLMFAFTVIGLAGLCGIAAYEHGSRVLSSLGFNLTPVTVTCRWQPVADQTGTVQFFATFQNDGDGNLTLIPTEFNPYGGDLEPRPANVRVVFVDRKLPEELEELLPPYDNPPDPSPTADRWKVQIAADCDGRWIPVSAVGCLQEMETAAGKLPSHRRVRWRCVFSYPRLDVEDDDSDIAFPRRLRIRMAAGNGETRRPEQIIEVPPDIQRDWKQRASSLARYREHRQNGQAAMKQRQFRGARSWLATAQSAAEQLGRSDDNRLLTAISAELQEAQEALAEQQQLEQLEREISGFQQRTGGWKTMLADAKQKEEANELEADGMAKRLLADIGQDVPDVPEGIWLADQADELRQRASQIRPETNRIREEAQQLVARIQHRVFDGNRETAAQSYDRFDYEGAFRQAAALLRKRPADPTTKALLASATTALRCGQRFHCDHAAATEPLLTFNADSTELIAMTQRGRMEVRSTDSGEPIGDPAMHGGGYQIAAFGAGGTRLATFHKVEGLQVWNAEDRQKKPAVLQTESTYEKYATALAFNAAGDRLFTANERGVFKWDLKSRQKEDTLLWLELFREVGGRREKVQFVPITALSLVAEGQLLLAGRKDGEILFLDPSHSRQQILKKVSLENDTSAVLSISVSASGAEFATLHDSGTVACWDRNGKLISTISSQHHCTSAGYGPRGRFWTGHRDGRVMLRERSSERPASTYKVHESAVTSIAIGSRNLIATGSDTGAVRVWDVRQARDEDEIRKLLADAGLDENVPREVDQDAPREIPMQLPARQAGGVDGNSSPTGPRGVAFHENFEGVPVGNLPDGWTGDGTVIVSQAGGASWLETSADRPLQAVTPVIRFPEDFELEVWTSVSSGELRIIPQGPRGEGLPIVFKSRYGRSSVRLGDAEARQFSLHYQPVRIRLGRTGATFRLIIQDHVVVSQRIADATNFDRIRFDFDAPAGKCRIDSVSVLQHADHRPEPVPQELAEDFSKVAAGELPAGWTGLRTAAVRRGQGGAWIESTAGWNQWTQFTTPHLNVPRDFQLDIHAQLTVSSMRLVLEGEGNSPNLTAGFDSSFNRLTIQFTGAAEKRIAIGKRGFLPIRIEREGDTYRLLVDGQSVIARRADHPYRFRRIMVRLKGSSDRARLHKLELRRLVTAKAR